MKHLWDIKVPEEDGVQGITQALGIHPLLARCLVNRELMDPEEARSFLNPKLADLAAPELIPNMGPAVERLFSRARNGGDRGRFWGLRCRRHYVHNAAARFIKLVGLVCCRLFT